MSLNSKAIQITTVLTESKHKIIEQPEVSMITKGVKIT